MALVIPPRIQSVLRSETSSLKKTRECYGHSTSPLSSHAQYLDGAGVKGYKGVFLSACVSGILVMNYLHHNCIACC